MIEGNVSATTCESVLEIGSEDTTLILEDPQTRSANYVTYQGGYSLTGMRAKNEDSFHIGNGQNLWLVSDGVGGAPFGEVISRVACSSFARAWNTPEHMALPAKERLLACLAETDAYVSDLSDRLGGLGSGTTFIAACYENGMLHIASVGDSRAFLLRDNTLALVSGDGRAEETSNRLDQALGYHLNLTPQLTSVVTRPADILLICTDGVWSTQSPEQMIESLLKDLNGKNEISDLGNPQRMAYGVVESSNMSDNATAVVVLFTGELQS